MEQEQQVEVAVEMLGMVLDVPSQALGWWGHQPLHTCRRSKVTPSSSTSSAATT